MSQHTGSYKNSLNLLGEKYLNESHWPMHRIRLLECRAYFIELPSTFKMHSFIRKTSLFPFILVQDQDQDSLLVKRRNDNHSPGPVIRELVPSSHQRSELSNTILCIFSG